MTFEIMLIVGAAVLAAMFYFLSVITNQVNVPVWRFPRLMYHLSVLVFFMSVGYYVSTAIGYFPVILTGIGAIPGLYLVLLKAKSVPSNEIAVLQNTWYTQRLQNGDPIRLFSRGGIILHLPGEELIASWVQETQKDTFAIPNMETADDSLVDVIITYWIIPDFTNVQAFLVVDHNQNVWWQKAKASAKSMIGLRASDLLMQTNIKDAIRNKKNLSERLVNEKLKGDYLFEEEIQMGFKITGIKISDVNYTAAVQSAKEQVMKSEGYGDATWKMIEATKIPFALLSPQEQTQVVEKTRDRVLASDKKNVEIHIVDVQTDGGKGVDFATSNLVKAVLTK